MTNLDRTDTILAVADGVYRAIYEIATGSGRFDVPHELLYDAIRQGVRDAVWSLITGNTDQREEFYQAIRDGVTNGVDQLSIELRRGKIK